MGKRILCDQSVFSPFFYFLFLSFSIEKEVEKSSVVSEQEGHSVAWKICWWVLKIQFLKIYNEFNLEKVGKSHADMQFSLGAYFFP